MVLELPGFAPENQNWKFYRAHILDSAAAEGVVSHLSGAAPKPVDSRELEAWNSSNAVAKYIILEVITDSLLERLMHHELAHTLFSHLAAIFGDHEPIAIDLPAERSNQDEPLREDSHPKSDGADSARTADTVEGTSAAAELKTTEIRDEKPCSTKPTGIPSTTSTTTYPKDPGDPPNAPDGTSRGDVQETAESGGQWQRTVRKVNRNDEKASPAPNLADRTSEVTTGDGPISISRTRPIKTVKHQHKSTRNIPLPIGRANANAQHSNKHPKPKICLPRRHRPPLEGERVGGAATGYTHNSSGQSMPQKLAATSNESDALVIASIESETLTIVSIESEDSGSGETIARIRLGGMSPRADDANGPGRRTDLSSGQADESKGQADTLNVSYNAKTAGVSDDDRGGMYLGTRGAKRAVDSANGLGSRTEMSEGQTEMSRAQTDAPNASNTAETAYIHHSESAETYLGARDANRAVDETDGIGSHADASTRHEDAHSVKTDALKPANATEIVSTHLIELKRPNSPVGDAKRGVDVMDGLASHMDTSSGRMDAPSARTYAITPTDEVGNIRTRPNNSKSPNSPMEAAWQCSDEPNASGNTPDTAGVHTDGQSVKTDALTPGNAPETVSICPLELKTPDSPAGSATSRSDAMDGFGSHTDTSNTCTDAHTVGNETESPGIEARTVRTLQNESKTNNSPVETASQRSDEPNGCRDRTDASSVRTDAHSVETHARTAANAPERIRTRQTDSKPQNSPYMRETATPKSTYRWRRVSVDGINVYLPLNAPIDDSSRMFVFERVEGGVEQIVARVVDETTGDGDGRWNGGDGSMDGTTSGNSIDPTRVNAALLATDSQQTRSRRITRNDDLPVSSWPPIQPADRPYGPARHQRRRGKLKIERINDKSISQTPRAETTHLARTHAAQPHGNPSKRFHRVHTPIRRRDPIKIAPTNVSQAPEDEGTHLGCDPIAQPREDDPQHSYRVIGPRRRRGRLKTRPTNVSRKRKERTCLPRALQAHTPPPTRSIRSHAIPVHRKSSIRPSELEERPAKRLAATTRSLIASNTHLGANGSTTRNALIADT
jgi:hypothetical protein